jgi:cytochrome oxidase Cu insertion factor (SCO1/SenC/PrrC family)
LYLNLSGTSITDAGLVHLKELRLLKAFFAYQTHVSEAWISYLKETTNLQQTVYSQKHTLVRPRIGDIAPQFSGQTIDGKSWKLEDYRGKVILMHLWWTKCKPCIASLPALKAMHEDLSSHKQFAMISVTIDPESETQNVVKKYGINWPHIANGQFIARTYGTNSSPAYFIVGPEGKIIANDNLGNDLNRIKTAVLRVLNATGKPRR